MKNKSIIIAALSVLTLTSCERGCQRLKRDVQSSNLDYDIKVYSGGQLIYHDRVKTILNSSVNSDGYYYYKGDTLIELSGQCVIKAL